MRLPRMSTGAWIFATAALVLAVAAPVSYAAATSTVAIGNASGSATALVDPEKQLLTNQVSPNNVVRFTKVVPTDGSCASVYTPPANKALVITSVTYDVGFNSAVSGDGGDVAIANADCSVLYDFATTSDSLASPQHTFPAGLPVGAVYASANSDVAFVSVVGYLIPAGELPPASQVPHVSTRQLAKLHAVRH